MSSLATMNSFSGPRGQSGQAGRKAALVAGLPRDAADALARGTSHQFDLNTQAQQAQAQEFNMMNANLGGIMELFMALQGQKQGPQASPLAASYGTPGPQGEGMPAGSYGPVRTAMTGGLPPAPGGIMPGTERTPMQAQPQAAQAPMPENNFTPRARQAVTMLPDEQLLALYRALQMAPTDPNYGSGI